MTIDPRQTTMRVAKAVAAILSLMVSVDAASPAWAQWPFDLFGPGPERWRAPVMRERAPPRPRPKRDDAKRKRDTHKGQQPAKPGEPDAAEAPAPPYEPQMTRLAEILGALSFLRDLCGDNDGAEWRTKMSTLLEAEAKSGSRRQRLTSAFNRGFRGYEMTYRECTPNARLAISRYLDEGSHLTHDITYRYGNP